MAIPLDRCIQRTYPTATLARTQPRASPSLGETVVLKAKPAGLQRTESNYVPSQPSLVDDAESSVTRKISSPTIETSLLDDFIEANNPGTYKEFYPVTLDDFLLLKNKLDLTGEISYIHLAQERTLFIMVNSDAHAMIAAAARDQFYLAMLKQKTLNPLLAEWRLHTCRPVWYNDAEEHYAADMTLFFRILPLLHLEAAFTQNWDVLRRKIDRMLLNKNTWGVLVVRLTENSTYSKPTQVVKNNDFISFDNFDAEMRRAQAADEYGTLSMNGLEWMKGVTCQVYFFPSDWEVGLADPQAYPLNGDRETFTNLNRQLTDVWSGIVRDIGRRLSCPVDPIELSIDWPEVHEKVVEGLRYTAFNRYLGWFGPVRHRVQDEAEEQARGEPGLDRPRKRARSA